MHVPRIWPLCSAKFSMGDFSTTEAAQPLRGLRASLLLTLIALKYVRYSAWMSGWCNLTCQCTTRDHQGPKPHLLTNARASSPIIHIIYLVYIFVEVWWYWVSVWHACAHQVEYWPILGKLFHVSWLCWSPGDWTGILYRDDCTHR
jgi:hypothetical protein